MILYLDFDGVLHPAEDVVLDPYTNEVTLRHRDPAARLFMHAPIMEEILAPHPDVMIILSTSWGSQFGLEGAAAYLPKKLRNRVIGKISHSMRPRGVQIAQHAKYHINGEAWIAIDDTIRMWPTEHLDKLIQCDPDLGLGSKETQLELKIKLKAMK